MINKALALAVLCSPLVAILWGVCAYWGWRGLLLPVLFSAAVAIAAGATQLWFWALDQWK